jgi:ferredoxin, 2Fe-2S
MTDPATYEVDFEPIGKRVLVEEGVSLLAAAQAAGVHLSSTCGGDWGCGQCQVIILEGQVSEPNSNEKFILEA